MFKAYRAMDAAGLWYVATTVGLHEAWVWDGDDVAPTKLGQEGYRWRQIAVIQMGDE